MNRKIMPGEKKRLTTGRQKQILDAAVKVFSQKGFSGATTKEIAKEAGVAEGTIFRYFKTKKEILLGLVGPYIAQSLAETIDETSDKSDRIVLKAVIKNRLELIKKNIDLVRLLITEAQFHSDLREQFTEKIVLRSAGLLEAFIARKVQSGEYRNIDPRIASRALAGMVAIFVLWKEFLFGDKYIAFDEEEVIETVVDIFLNGILNKRGKEAAAQ